MNSSKLQKICDIMDWSDPVLIRIIKDNLRAHPHYHRKQWEFAMIYRALEEAGVLNENSEGIAFGAGKERLIYSVMEKVKKLTATDLYSSDAHWGGTKTDTPKEYLLGLAPFKVDPQKLDAKYMNMREISYADESFDFAYSSCVFEHISKDDSGFVEHLNEVRRVLKEDGVYAMTTEFVYGDKTVALPGSHFFEIHHLLDIIRQSGLHVEPVFDARLHEISANEPAPLSADFGFTFGRNWMPHVTCLRESIVFTSCLLLIRKNSNKAQQPVKVLGLEETMAYVSRTLNKNINGLWRNWQNVSPTRGISGKPSIVGHENFEVDAKRNSKYLAFHSPFFQMGRGSVEVRLHMASGVKAKTVIKLISCVDHAGKELVVEDKTKAELQPNHLQTVELTCQLKPDRIYAVMARGEMVFSLLNIQMRKVNS